MNKSKDRNHLQGLEDLHILCDCSEVAGRRISILVHFWSQIANFNRGSSSSSLIINCGAEVWDDVDICYIRPEMTQKGHFAASDFNRTT